ncbi:MAG: hypothetical protein R3B06_12555 [Kofleriaceae bacterium]
MEESLITLNGREAALLAGALSIFGFWSFEQPAARALVTTDMRRRVSPVGDAVYSRWQARLKVARLWYPPDMGTPELVAQRGTVPDAVVVRSSELDVAIAALTLVDLEFSSNWDRFLGLAPGPLEWYGLDRTDVGLLQARLEAGRVAAWEVTLNGKEAALMVGALAIAASDLVGNQDAIELPTQPCHEPFDATGREIDRRWQSRMNGAGLGLPRFAPFTPEFVQRRGQIQDALVITGDEIEDAITGLDITMLEFARSWGEFCMVATSMHEFYGVVPGDLAVLRAKLQARDPGRGGQGPRTRSRSLASYAFLRPPFTLQFPYMTEDKLRAYAAWFHDVTPARIAELARAIQRTPGFEGWQPDRSPSSLEGLGQWLQAQAEADDPGGEVADAGDAALADELVNRTLFLGMDLGMYVAEVVLRNLLCIRWHQVFWDEQCADYGQPVLIGPGMAPINPVRLMAIQAYRAIRRQPIDLRGLYDDWEKMDTPCVNLT